jgi:short-subunit dehydrogenase
MPGYRSGLSPASYRDAETFYSSRDRAEAVFAVRICSEIMIFQQRIARMKIRRSTATQWSRNCTPICMAKQPETVVVTGASAGVGRATVREFAKRGARIGLIARSAIALENARNEVIALGGRAMIVPADVANHEEVNAAANAVEQNFGPIDIWINNAMVSVFSPFQEMTADEFRRVTEVTYLGVVYGTMAALQRMKPRNHGTIVQVGSALAYRSIPLQSAYCGAKHAIVGFTDSLRSELRHDKSKVHLTVVHLPAMNTPQFEWVKSRLPRKPQPVPPIFQPEVAGRGIYWAAHRRRREVEIGLPTVAAIIGNKIFPGLLDRYLARHAYDAQQTNEPADPAQPNNLWTPLPQDFGAHGRFSGRSRSWSFQFWLTRHRTWLRAAIGAIAGATCLAYTMDRWNSKQSSSAPARTALRPPLKLPGQVIPFASSNRETRSVAERGRQS